MSLLSRKRWVKWSLFGFGAIFGAWPDAAPAIAYWLGWESDRWSLYNVYHHSWTWFDLLPPFGLHVLSDIPFHPYPGFDWWPSLWYLEVTLVILSVAIFVYSFTVRMEST